MNRLLPRLPLTTSLLAAGVVIVAGAGCKRQSAVTYTAPKEGESVAPAAQASAPPAHADGSPLDSTAPKPPSRAELPRVAWQLPAGWQVTGPGQMSAATFAVKGEGGQATVSVTPLPNLAGQEAMIVNMWRQQAGATELKPEEAEAALQSVEISGQPGRLFEITATAKEGKTMRIVTSILNRPEGSWFFKMQGDESVVSAQRDAYLAFLKTFQFEDAPAVSQVAVPERPALPAMSSGPSAADSPSVEPYAAFPTPEGWRPVAAGQMQEAKFAVPNQGAAKAEVAISMFGSDTGGNNANISRWRRQIGMPEISEEELKKIPQPLDPALPEAVVADLQHESKRLIGAIVPREGKWWFYKLTGDAEAVTAARETFLTFAKTAPKS